MEDYIKCFRFKPEGVLERLARVYSLAQHPDDLMKRQADEYASLVFDVDRLFRDSAQLPGAAIGLDRETQPPCSGDIADGKTDEELFRVSPWLQTRDDVLRLSAGLANRVYNYPSELSKYVTRGAFCSFQDMLRDMIGRLVEVLLYLNDLGVVPLGDLDQTISGLAVQPQDAYPRVLGILHCANPADTLAPLAALTRETETMVQAKGS